MVRRRGQADGAPQADPAPVEPTRFLIARAGEIARSRRKPFRIKLRFRIQHIMWLSLWTAVILAIRQPLIASLPTLAAAIVAVSMVACAAMFVSLFGIALFMEEGQLKDRVVLYVILAVAGDFLLVLGLGVVAFATRI